MASTDRSFARTLWPVSAAVGMPLLLIALLSTPIGPNFIFVILGIPVLLFAWACMGMGALIISSRRIKRREWSQAFISAVLPVTVLVVALQFWNFIHLCSYCGDVVHFIARRSSYLQEIRAMPPDGRPRLLVFNLGGMSWASRGYVYDESDEVLQPEPKRSSDWKKRAEQTELTCGYYAEPFPGHLPFTKHWYIASFNC